MASILFKYIREPRSNGTEMGGTCGMIEAEETFLQGFGG
jgi:hypothetical protein